MSVCQELEKSDIDSKRRFGTSGAFFIPLVPAVLFSPAAAAEKLFGSDFS